MGGAAEERIAYEIVRGGREGEGKRREEREGNGVRGQERRMKKGKKGKERRKEQRRETSM